MTVVALIPRRPRCGVSDYAGHLYGQPWAADCGVRVRPLDLKFGNCLRAPFLGARVVHLQHEYSIYGFAGCWGFLLLLYYFVALRLTRTRLVITLHTIYDWSDTARVFAHRTSSKLLLRLLGMFGHVYHRLMLAAAGALVFLSDLSRAKFCRVTPRGSAARLAVIPIGVYDLPLREDGLPVVRERYRIRDSDRVFTLFGFAFPNKGYHLAIEALARLPDFPAARLFIVSGEPAEGGANYLAQLRELAAARGVADRVVFTGFLPFADPALDGLLLRTDCFIYPYVGESATSGSLATTLSARKIYLTSDLEMFREFTPAVRFRAGDVDDLAGKLRQVLAMDPEELARQRQQVEAYIAANNVPAMRQRHATLFLQLTS